MVRLKKLILYLSFLLFSQSVAMLRTSNEEAILARGSILSVQQLSSIVEDIFVLSKKIDEESRIVSMPQLSQGAHVISGIVAELQDLKGYLFSICSTFETMDSCSRIVVSLAREAQEVKSLVEEWLKPTCSVNDTRKLRSSLEKWRTIFFGRYEVEEGKLLESLIFESIADRSIAEREMRKIERLKRMREAQSLMGEMVVTNVRVDSDIEQIRRKGRVDDAEAVASIATARRVASVAEVDTEVAMATRGLTVTEAVMRIGSNITQTIRDIEKTKMETDMLPFRREMEEANMAMDLAEKRMKVLKSKAEVKEAEAKAKKARAEAFEAKSKAISEAEKARAEAAKATAEADLEVRKKNAEAAEAEAKAAFSVIKSAFDAFSSGD
jgi:hypothetical protein